MLEYLCISLCVNIFSFLLGKYSGAGLLGHMISVYITSLKTKPKHSAKIFSKVVVSFFHCHQQYMSSNYSTLWTIETIFLCFCKMGAKKMWDPKLKTSFGKLIYNYSVARELQRELSNSVCVCLHLRENKSLWFWRHL